MLMNSAREMSVVRFGECYAYYTDVACTSKEVVGVCLSDP